MYKQKHDILIDNVVTYNSGRGNIGCSGAVQYTLTINNTRSLYGTAHNISFNHQATSTDISSGAGLFLNFFNVFNTDEANISFSVYNSDFSHNRVSFGAGMSIIWFSSPASNVLVKNCTFYNNTGNVFFWFVCVCICRYQDLWMHI